MDLRALLFIVFCILSITVHAQNANPIEDEYYLYWQPNVRINYSHFQAETDTDCKKFNEKYGFKMSGSIQLRGIVDIPKAHLSRRIKKRKGYDKSYLAPVFCKENSCFLSEDSIELEVYHLLFDVAEMCARGARKEILELQTEMSINNANTMYFATVRNKCDERMREIWGSIFQDVLIQNKDGSYAEWRKVVDELLEENIRFATQSNDINRLILGKPIEPDYVEADWIYLWEFEN
jgi:hypothetical protein